MNFVSNILIVLFMLFLVVGCRSSRSGIAHSDIETNHLKETRKDSIDFNAMFARYLHEQESNLAVRIVEYFPPEPDDTASHGPVKSVTDIDLSSKSKSDSTKQPETVYHQFRYYLGASHEIVKTETTYQVKSQPWYEPSFPTLF